MKAQTVHLLLAFLAGMIAYKMLFARTEGFPSFSEIVNASPPGAAYGFARDHV